MLQPHSGEAFAEATAAKEELPLQEMQIRYKSVPKVDNPLPSSSWASSWFPGEWKNPNYSFLLLFFESGAVGEEKNMTCLLEKEGRREAGEEVEEKGGGMTILEFEEL